jgi:hypothetical protein
MVLWCLLTVIDDFLHAIRHRRGRIGVQKEDLGIPSPHEGNSIRSGLHTRKGVTYCCRYCFPNS